MAIYHYYSAVPRPNARLNRSSPSHTRPPRRADGTRLATSPCVAFAQRGFGLPRSMTST